MPQGDKATRNTAIPFQCHPFEIEPHAPPATTLDGLELIRYPEDPTDQGKVIRMTLPEKGDITECYLFMQMIAPSDKALNVRIAIGRFVGSTITPDTSFDYNYVQNEHTIIRGSESAYNVAANGTLTVEANLIKRIPRNGESGYNKDGFVLIVWFDSVPDSINGYELLKFSVYGSCQIGLT